MDTALTAVEKEVYNLSLQIAHLDTAEDFARTKAKLQVSVDFVRVNFPATSRTKALEASIATLLRTLTVLEEKSLSKSSASPSYKETRRVTVKSSRSYDSSASSSQRRSSADAKPSLVYDKGWEETSEYARAEKRRHTPSPELPRRQSRHEDIPLLSRTRSPSPPPQREYQRVTEREESYRRSLRDRSAYDADAYSPDHRRHERALYRSRSRERRDDRYDREAYREDTRRSHDNYREDSYRRSDRSPERKDARRDRYRDQQDVYSRETEYPRESYPPAPAPEYTYEPPPSSAYAYTQPVSAPPPAYSYLPPAANPYSLPPPPQMAFPPPVASQPLFPITLPPPQQTFPTIPATLSNTPPILKSALKKTSAPSQPTWENNSFAVPTVAEVPPPAQSEVTPVTEADRILDEMSSEEATRTLIFSDLSPKTMDIAFKILLLHYGPIESYEFYIWPGVTHRGAKVVYESLHSSVTAKVRMSGIEHLGSIIQVSFGNLVVGKVLFLEDVPADFNHDDITSKFRLCGRVTRVSLFAQRAIAMVFYEDEDTALRALSYMRMNSKQAAGIKVDMCRASDYAMFGEQPPETEAMSAATPTVPSSLDQRIERLNSGLLPSVEPSSSLVSVPTNESMSSTGLRSIELNPFATGLNPELDLIIEGIPVAPDDYKVKPAITAHFATYTSKVIVRLYATSPTNAFRFAVVRFDRSDKALKAYRQSSRGVPLLGGKIRSVLPVTPIALQSSRERIVRYYTREHCYVFIEGLAPGVSISRLRILFSDHGVVEDVQVREEDHCAWIKFKQAKDALKAKKLTNNTAIGNTRVKVVTLSEEPSRVIRILSAFCGSLTGKGHNGGMNIRDYQKRVSLFFKTASMVKIFDSRQGLLYFSSIPEAVRQLPKMSLQFPSSAGRSFKYLDYHFAQREHEVFCYEDVPYENAIFDQYRPDHLSVALKSIPSARNMPITPPRQTPPGKTPLGQTPPGQTPPGKTPLGQTPPGQTPPGQTPLGRTPPVTSKKSDPPPTPPPKETGKPKTPVNNQVAKPKWKMLDTDNGEMYLHQLYSKEVVDLSFSATASRTLIVKNVNKYQDETEASMRQRFSRYGFVVSVYATGKIFDNKTEIGISSFSVEYDHLLSAAFAMHHNQTLKEAKTFIVTFADAAPSTLVWFSFGLPGSSVHLNDRALLDAFKEHFSITEMSVFRRQRYGFIRFCTLMKAMNAIQMRTNFTLAGKRIHLDFGSLSFLQLANDILEANPINFLLPGELGMTENKSANVSRYLGVVPRSCNVTLKEVQAIFIKYGLILDLFVMPHPEKRDQIIIEFETIFAVQDVLKPRTVKALGSQFILVQCMIPAASDCLHIVSKQKNPVADAISKQPNFFTLFDGTHNQTGIFDSIRSSFDFITSHRKNWSEANCMIDFASNISRLFCYQRAIHVKPVKECSRVVPVKPSALVSLKTFKAATFKPKKFVVPGVEQAEVFEYGTRSLKVTSIAININRDHVCEAFKRYGIICDVKLKPGVELIVEFDSVMACVKAMRDNTTHHLHALCKAPHVPLKMSFEYPTALSRKLWFGSLPIRIDCRAIQLHLQDSDWDLTSLKINECNGTAVALCSSDKVSARIKCKVASEAATTGWEVAFASIALFDMFSILKQSATPSLPSVCDVAENDPCHAKATRTILVQNIDRNVGEEDVTDAFRNCNGYLGLRLRENLNKKTLEAFVEFHTITAATELLRRSDVRIKGCPVKVEFAPHIASNCLWIGNLPKPHMEETLLAKFKSFGKLFAPTFVYDGRIALIHFANVQNAVDAFCKADRKIANTQLHIDFASQLLQDALFVNECGPKDLKEINGNLTEDEKEDDSIFFCPSGLVLTVENVAESQVNVVCQEFARFGQVLDLVYADSQVTLHLDSVQGALKAIQEMNGQFVGDQVIRVRFGRVTSPNVWLGNMTAGTDYKAVRTMLIRFGTLASFKAAPAVGQVFAEYHSESFAQLAEESLKGQSVGKIRLLSSGISAKAGLRLMAKHGLPVADLNPEQPPAKKMKLDETSRATPKPAVTPVRPAVAPVLASPSKPPAKESANNDQAKSAAQSAAQKEGEQKGGVQQTSATVLGGSAPTRGGGNQQRGGGNQQRGGGNQQRGGGNQQRGGGNQQSGGGNQQRGGKNRHRRGGNQHRGGGNQQRGDDSWGGGLSIPVAERRRGGQRGRGNKGGLFGW